MNQAAKGLVMQLFSEVTVVLGKMTGNGKEVIFGKPLA